MTQAEQTLFEIKTGKKSVRKMQTIAEIMEDGYSDFIGNKRKRKTRQVNKVEKRGVKIENKKARAENTRSKAQSRLILAKQGIVQPSGIGEGIKSIGVLGSKFLNPRTEVESVQSTGEEERTEVKPKASMLATIQKRTGEAGVTTNILEGEEERQNKTGETKEPARENNSKMYLIAAAAAAALFLFLKK